MSNRSQLMPAGNGGVMAAHRGFGLIEVAISLLVLSIGALGLARLQVSAKRVGFEAIQRAQAATLAMDLFERMRSNRGALQYYQSSGLGAATEERVTAPDKDCSRSRCSSPELSRWDLWQWERALDGVDTGGSAGGLVNAMACVTVSGSVVRLEIAWEGFQQLAAATDSGACGAGKFGPGDTRRQWLQMTSYIGRD
jgi:type IV pilus assembly protein PilV